jgi:hypothetical protein
MYKKITLLFALMSTLTQYASDKTTWLEIKPSYFFFSSSPMKKIYTNGGFEMQGSTSIPVCDYFDFYGSVGYRITRGEALSTCEKTTLTIIPVDIGLKPIFNCGKRFYSFFAIGPRYFHLHQHNKSPYVDYNIKSNGIGFFLNAGINTQLTPCILFGCFGEYSYEKKKICPTCPSVFSDGKVQIGGLAFGASIGYTF